MFSLDFKNLRLHEVQEAQFKFSSRFFSILESTYLMFSLDFKNLRLHEVQEAQGFLSFNILIKNNCYRKTLD